MNPRQLALLMEIMEIDFVVLETALYLNTHPTDENALRLHNTNAKKLQELKHTYHMEFGPLTNNMMSRSPWQYIESPWPWEIDFAGC